MKSKAIRLLLLIDSEKEIVMKKNKFLSLILVVALCILACQSVIAPEKTVRLTVPGCL